MKIWLGAPCVRIIMFFIMTNVELFLWILCHLKRFCPLDHMAFIYKYHLLRFQYTSSLTILSITLSSHHLLVSFSYVWSCDLSFRKRSHIPRRKVSLPNREGFREICPSLSLPLSKPIKEMRSHPAIQKEVSI